MAKLIFITKTRKLGSTKPMLVFLVFSWSIFTVWFPDKSGSTLRYNRLVRDRLTVASIFLFTVVKVGRNSHQPDDIADAPDDIADAGPLSV